MYIYFVLEKTIALIDTTSNSKLQSTAIKMKTTKTKSINKNNNPIEVKILEVIMCLFLG